MTMVPRLSSHRLSLVLLRSYRGMQKGVMTICAGVVRPQDQPRPAQVLQRHAKRHDDNLCQGCPPTGSASSCSGPAQARRHARCLHAPVDQRREQAKRCWQRMLLRAALEQQGGAMHCRRVHLCHEVGLQAEQVAAPVNIVEPVEVLVHQQLRRRLAQVDPRRDAVPAARGRLAGPLPRRQGWCTRSRCTRAAPHTSTARRVHQQPFPNCPSDYDRHEWHGTG